MHIWTISACLSVLASALTIRTPLHAMMTCAELLSGSPLASDQREHVELIRYSGKGVIHLLDEMLDFSRDDLRAVRPGIVAVQAWLGERPRPRDLPEAARRGRGRERLETETGRPLPRWSRPTGPR